MALRALLLGPRGQLGTDITAANAARPVLDLVPVGRDTLERSDLDAAEAFLRGQDLDVLINCCSYHKADEVEANAQHAFHINAHLVRRLARVCAERRAR